nr:DUF5136 domain-containing protein [Streptomyces sp. MBT84]
MTQLHTPKASRNQETGRLSFMSSVSRFSGAARPGVPSIGRDTAGLPAPRPVLSPPCPP